MTDLERLIAARDLLAAPGGWTQGWFARDNRGVSCDIPSANATCFCALGAWGRAGGDIASLDGFLRFGGAGAIVRWNDDPEQTQAEVVARFDAAIERERTRIAS